MVICFYFCPNLAEKSKGSRGHRGSQATVILGYETGRAPIELPESVQESTGVKTGSVLRSIK